MKFLIIGDLHGNKPEINYSGFDAVIAPGDFCGDKHTRKFKLMWEKANKKSKSHIDWDKFVEYKISKKQIKEGDKKSLEEFRKLEFEAFKDLKLEKEIRKGGLKDAHHRITKEEKARLSWLQ